MTLAELLKRTTWFHGEFEAVEAELCGHRPVAFVHLPPAKRGRLAAWLAFPTEQRRAAFEAVKDTAHAPIAYALDRLTNPAKYAPRPRQTAGDRAKAQTADAIAAFLADEEEDL